VHIAFPAGSAVHPKEPPSPMDAPSAQEDTSQVLAESPASESLADALSPAPPPSEAASPPIAPASNKMRPEPELDPELEADDESELDPELELGSLAGTEPSGASKGGEGLPVKVFAPGPGGRGCGLRLHAQVTATHQSGIAGPMGLPRQNRMSSRVMRDASLAPSCPYIVAPRLAMCSWHEQKPCGCFRQRIPRHFSIAPLPLPLRNAPHGGNRNGGDLDCHRMRGLQWKQRRQRRAGRQPLGRLERLGLLRVLGTRQ